MHINTFLSQEPQGAGSALFSQPKLSEVTSLASDGRTWPRAQSIGYQGRARLLTPLVQCKEAGVGLTHRAWEDFHGVGLRQWHDFPELPMAQGFALGSFMVVSGNS